MRDSHKSILLVEDSTPDAELVKAALLTAHVLNPVDHVFDGQEALEYLRTKPHPVLILSDINMPRVDGLKLLEAAKADPVLKLLPFVMLTSSREDADLMKAYNDGVSSYVTKPIDFNEFAEVVARLGIYWTLINTLPQNAA